jgi:hypothetical protein
MTSFPVTTIDFLPADFHAQRRRRSVHRGRWVTAAAFLMLTLLGFAGNHLQHARLQAELGRLKPQASGVANLRSSLDQLTQQILLLELQADVRSRLRHRPAPTRLLASVTSAMPAALTLHELEIRNEQPVGSVTSANRNAEEGAEAKRPEQLDLDRLIADQSRQVLTVRGFAPNDAIVSEYLVRLRKTGTFDDVTLLFTDRYDREGAERRTFSVRLRVRPALSSLAASAAPIGGAS